MEPEEKPSESLESPSPLPGHTQDIPMEIVFAEEPGRGDAANSPAPRKQVSDTQDGAADKP